MTLWPFIEAEQAEQRNVVRACALLEVSRSAYYAHRAGPSLQDQPDEADHAFVGVLGHPHAGQVETGQVLLEAGAAGLGRRRSGTRLIHGRRCGGGDRRSPGIEPPMLGRQLGPQLPACTVVGRPVPPDHHCGCSARGRKSLRHSLIVTRQPRPATPFRSTSDLRFC